MTSSAGQGTTASTIQFSLERHRLRGPGRNSRIAVRRSSCRRHVDTPAVPKGEPADSPIFFRRFTSALLPLSTVNEYAKTFLAQRSPPSSGVAQCRCKASKVRGGVQSTPMHSSGAGRHQRSRAVRSANANVHLPGTLYGKDRMFRCRRRGSQLGRPPSAPYVTYLHVRAAPLSELACVKTAWKNDKVAACSRPARHRTCNLPATRHHTIGR